MNPKEKERQCKKAFDRVQHYWHAYTSGKETPVLFVNDEDFAFVMNVVAYAAYERLKSVRIIAFQIMGNHFHFILMGNQGEVEAFYAIIKRKLSRTFPEMKNVKLSLKTICDLAALRNNIVYVNRNGYVAHPDYTPFSYPWGTSQYYFNRYHFNGELKDLYSSTLRIMFRGRDPQLPEEWKTVDNKYIIPASYCAIKFGMSLFRDAHHYFSMVSKNVEAYSGVATDIDEDDFLTDGELFSKIITIIKEQYNTGMLRDLSKAQILELARKLHYDFRSSNAQIRRLLKLTQYEVDTLFPLSVKY